MDIDLDMQPRWWSPSASNRPRLSFVNGADLGGGPEDDEPDEDEELDEDEEEDDELADKSDDELRDMLRETQARLNRSSSSNASKNKRIKALKHQLSENGASQAAQKVNGTAPDIDKVRAAALAEARSELNRNVVKAEARGALRAAGVNSDRIARAVGLLELDDVDVDDDGQVSSDDIDAAIDRLRDDLPELFGDPATVRRPRPSIAGKSDRGVDRTPERTPTATELQVAAALGKSVREVQRSTSA